MDNGTATKLILEILKDEAVKQVVKKLVIDTFIGKLFVKYVIEEIINDYGLPLVNAAFREVNYQFDRVNGVLLVRRLDNAQDATEYNNVIDAIHRM